MEPPGQDVLEDVISVGSCSGDENASVRKRSHDEASGSDRSSQDGGSSLRGAKRTKRMRLSRADASRDSSRREGKASSSSEEGEVDEESPDRGPHRPPGNNSAAAVAQLAPTGAQDSTGPRQDAAACAVQDSQPPPSLQGRQGDAQARFAFLPPNAPLFRKKLRLPAFSGQKLSWAERFIDWVAVLLASNPEQRSTVTPWLAEEAYNHHVDQKSGLRRQQKKLARQAAQDVKKTGELERLLRGLGAKTDEPQSEMTLDDRPLKESDGNGQAADRDGARKQTNDATPEDVGPQGNGTASDGHDAETSVSQGDADEHEGGGTDPLEQLRRYFPSASDPSRMCLSCGREGHSSATCPRLACCFCNKPHWQYSCPTRSRCAKCRQLGHPADQCVEKLALTRDEGLACAFCEAPDHLEDQCTQVWRSFRPDADTVTRVIAIPATCAFCGREGHFAADCLQSSNTTVRNPTWSLANRDRYVDPNCKALSIEQAAASTKAQAKTTWEPNHRTRGPATHANHVHYSESDDSDGAFLDGSKAAKPRAGLGKISLSTNIQMPNESWPGRSWRQPPLPPGQQPPLPPGPPPPTPGRRQPQNSLGHPPPPGVAAYNGQVRGPPPSASLPTRPPASTRRDYRRVPPPPPPTQGQGGRGSSWQPRGVRGTVLDQRGGRSGGGGRGRGKGRGRGRG